MLRVGHDRFLPGLQRLTEAVREASGGQTKLLIQIIDFLSIRRRPDRTKFFQQFLRVTDAHRTALGAPGMSEADVREKLGMLSDEKLGKILSSREMEALRYGDRERVTDMTPAADPRPAADVAGAVFVRRLARETGRLRRRRTALCTRLYDGLVPFAHEHARRRLWRIAAKAA